MNGDTCGMLYASNTSTIDCNKNAFKPTGFPAFGLVLF